VVIGLLAEIPYRTYPQIEVGPATVRTFGLLVAVGVLIGAWFAARYAEEHGVTREQTYSLAVRIVIGGMIGARLTWVLSHTDRIDSPIDVIAVWEGGLQFSGGFIAGVLVGYPFYRKWFRPIRWKSLDGYAYGLTIGLAFGRIACYSVGEHFGGQTNFPLAVRFEGGPVREAALGDTPLALDMTFHNTALYELMYLMVLFVFFTWLMYVRPTRPPTGTIIGLFCLSYGTLRFLSDFIRVNDRTVLGLTGAQFLMLSLLPAGIWILFRVRRLVAADEAAGVPAVGAGVAAEPASAGTRPDAPAGSAVPPDSGEATEVP
jgi:phosphatidylglycerol---prolipoprotein diacylglyceryl transferase